MMARGTMNNTTSSLLQGNVDTGFKLDKRTTLGTIKSVADLEDRLQALTSGQHTVMEHVESNLKVVLMGAGYTAEDAALLAHNSPFLRISVDSQVAYIGLHMHLFNVGLQHGWDHLKTELHYHVKKLKAIRALYPNRLQIIAHNYCYLRDLKAHKWQTFGIQDLRIRELQAVYSPPRPTLPPREEVTEAPPPQVVKAEYTTATTARLCYIPGTRPLVSGRAKVPPTPRRLGPMPSGALVMGRLQCSPEMGTTMGWLKSHNPPPTFLPCQCNL
jgi:hypothetical protein